MKHGLLLATIVGSAALSAQSPPVRPASPAQPPATVTGRVVTPPAPGMPVVLTDSNGRFSIAMPAGRNRISAGKTGYAKQVVEAAPGAPREIRLVRGAVIAGRVIDAFGDPVQGVRVTAETAASASEQEVRPGVASADTDDLGEYRLAGLPPGAVKVSTFDLIMMSIDPTRRTRPEKSYYPGVPAAADAEVFQLKPGDERTRIDFVVQPRPLMLPAVAAARIARGEQPPRGKALVRGRVVTTDGRAVGHAEVRLTGGDVMHSRIVRSDGDGNFEFTEVVPSRYQIAASKVGYQQVPASAGSSEDRVTIAADEIRDRLEITLDKWKAMTGRIVDELGDPIEGASVVAYQVRYSDGRRRLVEARGARLTNDLGFYRLYGLAPGSYIVGASVGGVSAAELPGYGRTYYAGASSPADAQYVAVGTSDVAGIEFAMSRASTVRVAGTMTTLDGRPIAGGITLTPSRSASIVGTSIGARILPDGSFEFPNVSPGQYVIRGDRGRENGWTEGEFAAMPVSVAGADVSGLVVQTSRGSSIAGRITFDGTTPPPAGGVELRPVPVDPDLSPGNIASADIRSDLTFQLAGINGPRRLQVTQTPPGWALKQIRVNGFDVADRPLPFGAPAQSLAGVEVVLADRFNTVNVRVADDRAAPAAGVPVIVFAADRDRWYPVSRFLRTTTTGAQGTVAITGLPAGSYYVVAVDKLPPDGDDAWQEPRYLESLIPRSTSVTLGENEQRAVVLRLPSR